MTWTVEIPGPPVAKQRPRRAPQGHFYTPAKTVKAEKTIAEYAMAAGVRLEPKRKYALGICFYLSAHRRDIDNLQKTVLDGLNRLGETDGWDDHQVTSLGSQIVSVRDGSEEKTVILIRGL
ncbi:MAG: RusA family crossover junction endodeoxyribonuclease [Armatimonadetes bacterium]|nr:RusA family crossover junction endodeoxyribonuclease [Armatimonadota bacterium]